MKAWEGGLLLRNTGRELRGVSGLQAVLCCLPLTAPTLNPAVLALAPVWAGLLLVVSLSLLMGAWEGGLLLLSTEYIKDAVYCPRLRAGLCCAPPPHAFLTPTPVWGGLLLMESLSLVVELRGCCSTACEDSCVVSSVGVQGGLRGRGPQHAARGQSPRAGTAGAGTLGWCPETPGFRCAKRLHALV